MLGLVDVVVQCTVCKPDLILEFQHWGGGLCACMFARHYMSRPCQHALATTCLTPSSSHTPATFLLAL